MDIDEGGFLVVGRGSAEIAVHEPKYLFWNFHFLIALIMSVNYYTHFMKKSPNENVIIFRKGIFCPCRDL